jgi:ABC-type nitrate/sulfonate/bicarbonate transport system permease component
MNVKALSPRPLAPRPLSRAGQALAASLPWVVAVGLGLIGWTTLSVSSGGWVPSVPEIADALGQQITTGSTYEQVWITARRILVVFAVVLALGIFIGTLMGLSSTVRSFLQPLVVTGLAIPDVVYFIFAALAIGTEERAGLIAMGIAVIPYVINIVNAGAQARDPGLDEMSKAYRLRRRSYLWDVVGLQMTPALLAASRTGFAFTWKLVVLMEAISQPDGIGAQIYLAFRLLRPDEMISLALIFIVIVVLVDVLIFGRMERRLLAWMREPGRPVPTPVA